MIYLIKRELKKDGRSMVSGLLLILFSLIILTVFCILLKEQAVQLEELFFGLPAEIHSLSGFPIVPGEYNMQFYYKVYLMIANVIIAIIFCYRVCDVVERDEYDGSIFYLCNQLYSRKEMILGKYFGTVIEYIIQYILMMIMVSAAEYDVDDKTIELNRLVADNVGLLFGGICIGILYISISYAFCVYDNKKNELELTLFTVLITLGLLVVGNIRRIIMAISYFISIYKPDAAVADKLKNLGKLKILRNISPLSHLNPNNHYSTGMWIKVCVISVLLSGVFVLLMLFLYRRRHIEK